MKDHSCEFPYILNDGKPCLSRAYQTHSGCDAWLCPEHLRSHDCERVKSWLVGGASLNAVPSLDPGRPLKKHQPQGLGEEFQALHDQVEDEMDSMAGFARRDETNVLFDIADFATMSEAWKLLGNDLDLMPGYIVGQLEVSSIWEILKSSPFEDLVDWEHPPEVVGVEAMGTFITVYFSQLRASEYVGSPGD